MGRANSAAGNEVDMCTQLFQWYLTLCDPVDCILTGSSVHGILQARILEWVAMPSSGDLSKPGIKPRSPTLQADSLSAELQGRPKFFSIDDFKS